MRLAFETQRKLSLFTTTCSMSPLYLSSFAALFFEVSFYSFFSDVLAAFYS